MTVSAVEVDGLLCFLHLCIYVLTRRRKLRTGSIYNVFYVHSPHLTLGETSVYINSDLFLQYGVATMSRLLATVGLFCIKSSLL